MNKLTSRLQLLITNGTHSAGTYDPSEALSSVEEQMTIDEYRLAESFLTWVCADQENRKFGHGNLSLRWNTWQASPDAAKPKKVKQQESKQVKQEAERRQALITHWCPENLHFEGFPNTLMRAFMSATACCADQKRKLDGHEPIRPLASYPDPMFGFQNTPTGN